MSSTSRILLVDDEPSILEMTREFLEQHEEFEIVTASSAFEGMKKIEGSSIDAIVSDYQMPDMNGIEFLKLIREKDDIPFILFTGKGREEVAIEAINSGANFYIKKGGEPKTTFAELANAIEQGISRHQAERAQIETQERFRSLYDNAIGLVYTHDLRGNILDANQATLRILGYSLEEMVGMNVKELVVAEQVPLAMSGIQEIVRTGTLRRFAEYGLRRKDGGHVDIEINGSLLYHDGKPYAIQGMGRDITERKRADSQRESAIEELRESESRLSLALGVGNAGIWEWNLESDEVRFDARFHTLLGYTPGELPNTLEEWKTFHHPHDYSEMMSRAKAYLQGDTVIYESEHRIRSKDGKWAWVFTRGQLVNLPSSGFQKKFIGIAINVTDRKEVAESLKKSELKFRNLFDWANDAIMLHTLSTDEAPGRFIDVNRVGCEMLGYSREELLTMGPSDIVPIEFHSQLREIIQLARTRESVLFEIQLRRKDGTTLAVESSGHLILYEGKRAWLSHIREITERNRACEALKQNEKRFEQLAEYAGEWIWEVNEEGIFTYSSPIVHSIIGFRPEELVGKLHFYDLMVPDVWKMVEEDVLATFRAKVPARALVNTVVRKDGGLVTLETSALPIEDETGRMLGYRGINRDVTDRKMALDAITEMNRKLRLLSMITSHDIRNQVRVLGSLVQQTRRDSSGMISTEHLVKMQQAIEKAQSFLNFEQEYLDRGKLRPNWYRLDEILLGLRLSFDSKYIQLEMDLEGWEIFSDAMIGQVFHNLVENTLHHGQRTTKVRFSAQEQEGSLILRYEDNGVGVPIELKESIFELGTGDERPHGLMMAREILAITGLTIEEKGVSGQGSLFEIKVPAGAFRRYSS